MTPSGQPDHHQDLKNGPVRPLVITLGEPAGIGPEIALKAWAARPQTGGAPFAVIGDPALLAATAEACGLDGGIAVIGELAAAGAVFDRALPVLALDLAAPVRSGEPDSRNAQAVLGAIEWATSLAMAGEAAGVVTCPIHKGVLYEHGFEFTGHTDYLAALCARAGGVRPQPEMMLACPGLRAVPVTIHIALSQVFESLSQERIVGCGRGVAAALTRDFGISEPRLAVTGLNPHAGEGGAMGTEEIDIIAPAIADLRAAGIAAEGPFPADSLFTDSRRRRFDAVLCMYHDQALIPVKTLDFRNVVNITLGLPIVRTSPGHGTALDIAGKGAAAPYSLIAALDAAAEIARRRAT